MYANLKVFLKIVVLYFWKLKVAPDRLAFDHSKIAVHLPLLYFTFAHPLTLASAHARRPQPSQAADLGLAPEQALGHHDSLPWLRGV